MKIIDRFLVPGMSGRSVQGQVRRRSSVGWDCPTHIRTQEHPCLYPVTNEQTKEPSPKGPLGAVLGAVRTTGLELLLGYTNSQPKIRSWLRVNTSGEQPN